MQMLVAEGRVTQDQLEGAIILQAEKGATIGYHLVHMGAISDDNLVQFLVRRFLVDHWSKSALENIPKGVISLLTSDLAQRFRILPLRRTGQFLTLGLTDPSANHVIEEVAFNCFGEVFINQDVVAMLRYGAERGVSFRFTSANFNHVSDEMIIALVECTVREVSIAFEGITQETYSIYRKRGKLDRVLDNIRKLNACKRACNSSLPELQWLWIIFGHNQFEIPRAREMAAELGMEFQTKLQWDSSYSPIRDPEQLKKDLDGGATSREE